MNKLMQALLLILLCFSCQKEYDPDLRGKWQLKQEIRGGIEKDVDSVFYNFDNQVFNITVVKSRIQFVSAFGLFSQKNDSLKLDLAEWYYQQIIEKDPSFGWQGETHVRHLKILELNSKTLRLRDSISEMTFRKI